MKRSNVVLGVVLFAAVASIASAAVLGIDFGSELIKVAIVKPGKPFHIVLDEHSKRKIPAIIGFDGTERHFGTGAQNLMVKRPKTTYANMLWLLGRNISSPQVERFRAEGYPYDFEANEERGTISIRHNKGVEEQEALYSPELLVSMTLQHLKRLAEADADQEVKDIVITVPSYWTQHERLALIDACTLAGFNVLSLLNQNPAAAIQYGIDFDYKLDKTYPVVFYNMGSTGTEVSLVIYSSTTKKSGKQEKIVGNFEIKGTTFDDSLGGQAFESRLVEWMVKDLNAKIKKSGEDIDIRNVPRGMAKLRTAAKKTKEVLSANTESGISVESVYGDIDFKAKITREEFYGLCGDLFERVTSPLQQLLEATDFKLNDLYAVVTVGGSTRIPQVEKVLKDWLASQSSTLDLSHNIDADESMAMGAAFFAANLSTQFRVRQLGMTDISIWPVGVRFQDLPGAAPAAADADSQHSSSSDDAASGSEEKAQTKKAFSKRATLFKRFNALEKRKSVVFSHDADFQCLMHYDSPQLLPKGVSPAIVSFNVTGVQSLLADEKATKIITANPQKPKVHLFFVLTADGLVELAKAEATLEELVQEKVEKKKANVTTTANATSANATESSSSESSGAEAKPAAAADEPPKSESSEEVKPEDKEKTGAEAKPAAADEPEEFRTVKKTRTFSLQVSRESLEVHQMARKDVVSSKAILSKLDAADRLRKEIAAAKNELEAYIYATRSKTGNQAFGAVTTPEQRQELISALQSAEDWLYEQADDGAEKFTARLMELKKLSDPIFFRVEEAEKRPQAISDAQKILKASKLALEAIQTNFTWVKNESTALLTEMIEETEKYLTDKLADQETKLPHEAPAFTADSLRAKLRPMTDYAQNLLKTPKPKPKSKPRSSTNATASANATGSSNSTDSSEAAAEEVPVDGAEGGDATSGQQSDSTDDASSSSSSSSSEKSDEAPPTENAGSEGSNTATADGEKEHKHEEL